MASLVALLSFAYVTVEVGERQPFGWEDDVLRAVAGVEDPLFEALMVIFAFLGAGVGLLILLTGVLVVLLRDGRRADAVFVVGAVLVSQVVERVIKNTLERPRPTAHDQELLASQSRLRDAALIAVALVVIALFATARRRLACVVVGVGVGAYVLLEVLAPLAVGTEHWAYPSGHATSSVAFASASALVLRDTARRGLLWGAAVVYAAGVGVSRVAFGVHNVTDVLGGWTLALGCTLLLGALFEATSRRWQPTPSWMPRPHRVEV